MSVRCCPTRYCGRKSATLTAASICQIGMILGHERPLSEVEVRDASLIQAVRAHVLDAYQFTRFAAIGFTIVLPWLGAASATDTVGLGRALGLGGLAIAFHLYAYVLNDVIDLDFDRAEPLRAADPLVRGLVSRGTALAIALAQVPVAFAGARMLGGGRVALGALTAALVGMGAYNLLGKRTGAPLATDLVQGLSWGCLVITGAALAPGTPSCLTSALVITVTVYIVFINGVHGALRDLGSDLAGGAHTMAIVLGARPAGVNALDVPLALRSYALALQLLLVGAVAVVTEAAWPRYTPSWRWLVVVSIAGASCAALALLAAAVRRVHDKWGFVALGMVHLVLSLATLIVPLVPLMSGSMRVLVVAAYICPIAAMLARYGVRWG
jgi:4-hydroxybenzoate polyprenyltransferase